MELFWIKMLTYVYPRFSLWKSLTWSPTWLGPEKILQLRLEGNFLARGWDSKGVEAQIEEATKEKTATSRGVRNTISQEHRSLLLAKTHIVNEIQFTTNARYLDLLQSSLAAVNKQLVELEWWFLQKQFVQSPEAYLLVIVSPAKRILQPMIPFYGIWSFHQPLSIIISVFLGVEVWLSQLPLENLIYETFDVEANPI